MKKLSSFILHLSSLILLLVATSSYAAKSTGAVRTVLQPDGTTLNIQLLGDENFCWYQTTDGVLLFEKDKAFYIGVVTGSGSLDDSGIIAHNTESRSAEEKEAASSQDRKRFFTQTEASMAKSKAMMSKSIVTSIPGYPSSSFCPHTETIKVPVIIMQYKDMALTFGKNEFEEYFNGTTTTPYSKETFLKGYSSVTQYFKDASNGSLNFEFVLFGPYTTDNNHDYYGHNGNESALATEAVNKADGDIDFTQYDSNNDGKVDMVYILYAGTGANTSGDNNDFWPKCWYDKSIVKDGKTINVIGAANELAFKDNASYGTCIAGVGVTCHEMSHGMGMPDLYRTTNAGIPHDPQGYVDYNNCGPEDWDIMDGGENIQKGLWPCQYTAWEKDAMGWINLEDLTEAADITLYPLNKEGGKAYKVTNPANQYEYYVIENYQNDEWNHFNNSHGGSGLMITHVNATSSGLSMNPNDVYGKPNVTILPADGFIFAMQSAGNTMQYKGSVITMPTKTETSDEYQNGIFAYKYFYPEMKGDPYPGTSNVTSLAAYKNYTGEEMINNYPITDITKNSDGSISFKFMGGKTAIKAIHESDMPVDYRIYTIDGRYIGNSLQTLPHGMYIVGGKKIIK